MYSRNTILVRKEPFVAPDPKADPPVEGDPRHIYNVVRVIGVSPIQHLGGAATWGGVGAQGVVIEPLAGFGGNVDRPYGELQQDYDIQQEPEPVKLEQTLRVINSATREAGPSPEEVFASQPKPVKTKKPAASR